MIRETQIETAIRYHLTPVRMVIKKSAYNKCWTGYVERDPPLHSIQLLWRTVWKFLKKLKIELSYDPAIPLLGVYPEKNCTSKRYREFPAVQWLGLFASTAGSTGLIPSWGTKILHVGDVAKKIHILTY